MIKAIPSTGALDLLFCLFSVIYPPPPAPFFLLSTIAKQIKNLFNSSSSPAVVLSFNSPPQPNFCKVFYTHSFFDLLLSILYIHSTSPLILLFLRSPIAFMLSNPVDAFLHLTRPLTRVHHGSPPPPSCSVLFSWLSWQHSLLVSSYCFGFHYPSPFLAFLPLTDLKMYFPKGHARYVSLFIQLSFPKLSHPVLWLQIPLITWQFLTLKFISWNQMSILRSSPFFATSFSTPPEPLTNLFFLYFYKWLLQPLSCSNERSEGHSWYSRLPLHIAPLQIQ